MYYYTDPDREHERYALPDVEVFYADWNDVWDWNDAAGLDEAEGDTLYEPGYYFAFGVPGCLWDSDPVGPYDTEEEALEAARDYALGD